jgi:hypothetical protein
LIPITVLGGNDYDPPIVIINFAGNLGDKGGPIWRPPDEGIPLSGYWKEGYYTNDSRQSENWIYISLTVIDVSEIDVVWLQWLNETTWTNWTYEFINVEGDYFEINTSSFFQTSPGFDYSFDIVANDSKSNSITKSWNKIGVSGELTRRYVQLNFPPTDISYMPFYLYESEGGGNSGPMQMDDDRLHHDQGPNDHDTGYLRSVFPRSNTEYCYCGDRIGFWFDESLCINPITIYNIYYHVWWNTSNGFIEEIGWNRTRNMLFMVQEENAFSASNSNSNSKIINGSDQYYLSSKLLDIKDTFFIDNDIYEFFISLDTINHFPKVISNRSVISYVLFNVPENSTLQGLDTDNDNLNDWEELYVTFTSPFVIDTDNDGISDYYEYITETDPNDYTDNQNIAPEIPVITGPTNGRIGLELFIVIK